ncbi:glycosyltransferase [Aequorivita vladivostokensis]|uniref:Glycosyl transferase family 1 domain-containing protein n=1 Tax=Aequorivita vladivostokensis TaxID=171194 RepID=A0ABR5DJ78_9FLAO|nr:glycosyltransferase [Aequorivita vladivostokensis]KJJ38845.1 hypothetical protein MB09_05205 [Aequorivita vladivostokensis]
MLLLDSLYINNSGGKVLLDYLVQRLEKKKVNCFYLFDKRCENDYNFIPDNRKIFLKASLLARNNFYIKNKSKFSKIFCLSNLPPLVKFKVPVYTYFHQPLFLAIPDSVSTITRIKLRAKSFVLNILKSNTNYWLVQSTLIKEGLAQKYKIDRNLIEVLPFFPPLDGDKINIPRRKDGFVYISNQGPHKNHQNLIEAFCNFYDKTKMGILHLTISAQSSPLIDIIEKKIKLEYPIVNHGFVLRRELYELYQSNEYLIYPSLAESFGLGLVEAIENGCKVIGADLPYTFAVCKPSLLFDPLNVNSIIKALIDSQGNNIKETKQLVFNQIDDLIQILKENNEDTK